MKAVGDVVTDSVSESMNNFNIKNSIAEHDTKTRTKSKGAFRGGDRKRHQKIHKPRTTRGLTNPE